MIVRSLLRFVEKIFPPSRRRVIFDREGAGPYLTRLYLKGAPRMADGSSPFDDGGAPKQDAIFPKGIGIYLHRFHRSDDSQELHDHPWKWALSLILSGGYYEERFMIGDGVKGRYVLPFMVNLITAKDFHRVDLLHEEAWSLFVTGPKFRNWGFLDRKTMTFTPWRDYIAGKRGSK